MFSPYQSYSDILEMPDRPWSYDLRDWHVFPAFDGAPAFLGHGPFEPLLPTFPIGHYLVEKFEERRPVMRLGHMAELVGDYVIDGIDRSLYQTPIEQ